MKIVRGSAGRALRISFGLAPANSRSTSAACGAHWYLDTFAANSLTDVTPRAPVRLYYGSEDKDVVPQEALGAAKAMAARGGDVRAVDVGPVGHDASMLAAAPSILAWLAELETRD